MWVSELRFGLRVVHLNWGVGGGYGLLFLRNLISGKWEGGQGLRPWKQRGAKDPLLLFSLKNDPNFRRVSVNTGNSREINTADLCLGLTAVG